MNTKEDGGPAFPSQVDMYGGRTEGAVRGMTLLDYFAAHAPEPPSGWHGGDRSVSDIIEWRWYYAGQMLKARAQ